MLSFDRRPATPSYEGLGLLLLDDTDFENVVVLAPDENMTAFRERIARYGGPLPEGQKAPYLVDLFDALRADRIREYSAADRKTERLSAALLRAKPDERLRIDVDCWHLGQPDDAVNALETIRTAARAAGGEVASSYHNLYAGLVLLRLIVPAAAIDALAELPEIARIDVLPGPLVDASTLRSATVDELPALLPVSDRAPIVALLDSGVRSSHPLLQPYIAASVSGSPEFADGEDDTVSGHGTRVAGILLHGSMADALRASPMAAPYCRLLSIRLLDADARVPDNVVWPEVLERAIDVAVAAGAKVINLAVGDPDTPYRGPRATHVAALLDTLAARHKLVIVLAAGNVHPDSYARDLTQGFLRGYALEMLASDGQVIFDPAPAALALTVGGLCTSRSAGGGGLRDDVARRPIGEPGWPSPFTCRGPGIGGAVKPELAAPAGSLAWDPDSHIVEDPELGCLSTSGAVATRLFDTDIGTSYAVPLVSRAAAAVLARYPRASANRVRALLLQAVASPNRGFYTSLTGPTAARDDAVRSLIGYGELRLDEAVNSADHRVVVTAENAIPVNGIHIYQVPVPTSFYDSGGERDIIVSLAYDPPVRSRRLDYLSNGMGFELLRGLTADQVAAIFGKTDPALEEMIRVIAGDDNDAEGTVEPEAADGGADEQEDEPASNLPSKLGWRRILLQPSGKRVRNHGTNQLGRKRFSRAFSRERDGDSLVLVVKNVYRWGDPNATQSYAVVVTFGRDEAHAEMYTELEAKLGVAIELQAQA